MKKKVLTALLIIGLLGTQMSAADVLAQEVDAEDIAGMEMDDVEYQADLPEQVTDDYIESSDEDENLNTGESASESGTQLQITDDPGSDTLNDSDDFEEAGELEPGADNEGESETGDEAAEDPFSELEQLVISDGWYTICVAGNEELCLNIDGYSEEDGKAVSLTQTLSNLAQRFYIYASDEESGYYYIKNIASGKYLGISGEATEDVSVRQWQDMSGDGMKVAFYQDEEGNVVIKSKLEENLVYSVDDESAGSGAGLKLFPYENKDTQKFALIEWTIPGKETEIADGTYKIYSAVSPGFAMDVKSASTSSGANVQLYTDNETGAQEWRIVRQGSWYTITNVKSGKRLDVAGGSQNSGVNVHQYDANGSNAQLFRFYQTEDGSFYIMSKYGTVVDIASASYKNGTNIQMYKWNGTGAQQWGLEPVIIPASTEKTLTEGYYTIRNVGSSNMLSVENQTAASGANIGVKAADGGDFQIYRLEKQSDGWYMLKNAASGKYLDVAGGSTKSGANLQQYNKNSTDAQKFKFYSTGSGSYYIKSKKLTVIEEKDGNACMYKASAADSQKWILTAALPESCAIDVTDGDYIMCSVINSNQVIDIKSGSKASGANAQLYANNGTNAQNFYISGTSDGWYTIQNNLSKLYLDVAGGSTKSGANLQQYTGNGTDAQKFRFYDVGDGKIVIKSKKGTVVDVKNANAYSGANVQLYTFNNTNAQKWILKAQLRKRVYQNPSQYYQIQDTISLSGGGYNLSVGYEGLKTAWVIRKLGFGNAVGMGGAYYSNSVASAVKSFQRKNGLSETGVVNLATWKAMGYTESQWYSLGAYVSPIRVNRDSTRSDCIEAMIDRAYDYLGDDYVIGASGAPGLGCDCSGLVMQALYAAGIDMETITPVTHAQPGHEYESVNIWNSSKFKHVSYSSRERGDLIVYCNSSGSVNHIAIYLGNNYVIESYPNKVIVSYITSSLHTHIKGVVRPFV